jgi:hypothetical protein
LYELGSHCTIDTILGIYPTLSIGSLIESAVTVYWIYDRLSDRHFFAVDGIQSNKLHRSLFFGSIIIAYRE